MGVLSSYFLTSHQSQVYMRENNPEYLRIAEFHCKTIIVFFRKMQRQSRKSTIVTDIAPGDVAFLSV
jgi:hypothetical protein